jgi:hypothetical protein
MHKVNKNYVSCKRFTARGFTGSTTTSNKLKQAGIQSILDLAVSIPNELAVGGEGGGCEGNVISGRIRVLVNYR